MDTGAQVPDELFGYAVLDSGGNKIGSVDGVWVDDATDQLEFIGIKTGWILGKTHVVPTANAQIEDDTVRLPYGEDQVKNAPSFGTDDELSADDENQIYGYYGLTRSTEVSPSGLPEGVELTPSGADAAPSGVDTSAAIPATESAGSGTTGYGPVADTTSDADVVSPGTDTTASAKTGTAADVAGTGTTVSGNQTMAAPPADGSRLRRVDRTSSDAGDETETNAGVADQTPGDRM